MSTSSPITLRKIALYLTIVLACLGLAWCSFSTEDDAPVELLQRPATSPAASAQSAASNATSPQQTEKADPLPADIDLRSEVKDMQARGKLPKIDVSKDIKGSDQNQNGVRDDIEAWIETQPMTDVQKRAATQKAIVLQKELVVDLHDKVAVQAVADESMHAKKCLVDAYNKNLDEAFNLSRKMDAMNTSTKERLIRSMKFSAAMSGMSVEIPKNYTCP